MKNSSKKFGAIFGVPSMKHVNHKNKHPMSSLNKVMLIGRLTRDPQTRHTPKGTACTEFGLAVNRTYLSESGEKREETTFVDVTLWGKTAEVAAKYLRKGNLTYLEGRLRMESWTDKATGQNRTKLSIVGDSVQFLEPASSNRNAAPPAAKPVTKPTVRPMAAAAITPHSNDADDWDEPF